MNPVDIVRVLNDLVNLFTEVGNMNREMNSYTTKLISGQVPPDIPTVCVEHSKKRITVVAHMDWYTIEWSRTCIHADMAGRPTILLENTLNEIVYSMPLTSLRGDDIAVLIKLFAEHRDVVDMLVERLRKLREEYAKQLEEVRRIVELVRVVDGRD